MAGQSTAFDKNTADYDQWFEKNPSLYKYEILAIQTLVNPYHTNEIEKPLSSYGKLCGD